MGTTKAPYRKPAPDEQQVLREMSVRLVRPQEVARFNQLLKTHHYLHRAQLVGEHLRYVVVWQGQWLALAAWSSAALHLAARDQFIGWSEEQRRCRLPLVVNNSRLCVLPACHYPNLVSRFMKLMLSRLSADWQAAWNHPVALAESFIDPQVFRGTAYKASGWSPLGETSGWKRSAVDFYERHDRPKQLWVRELVKRAGVKLRQPELPAEWASAVRQIPPRCTAKVEEIRSLMDQLAQDVPEFRSKRALAYPVAGMLVLIAMAMFSGVTKGYDDLAAYAATLSQGQLRALRFRLDQQGRVRCPKRTSFVRVLEGVDAAAVERVLLRWQAQQLGPVQDRLVIFDGKRHRHAGVDTVSAVSGSGRWLGSVVVPADTNEITAARDLIARLDLVGKVVTADAAHTQTETSQLILFEGGGDYALTVKENQKEMVQTLTTLLTEQRFSPSAHAAHPCGDARTQSRAAGDPGAGLSGSDPRASGLPGGAHDCQAPPPDPPERQKDDRTRLPHHQPHA